MHCPYFDLAPAQLYKQLPTADQHLRSVRNSPTQSPVGSRLSLGFEKNRKKNRLVSHCAFPPSLFSFDQPHLYSRHPSAAVKLLPPSPHHNHRANHSSSLTPLPAHSCHPVTYSPAHGVLWDFPHLLTSSARLQYDGVKVVPNEGAQRLIIFKKHYSFTHNKVSLDESQWCKRSLFQSFIESHRSFFSVFCYLFFF